MRPPEPETVGLEKEERELLPPSPSGHQPCSLQAFAHGISGIGQQMAPVFFAGGKRGSGALGIPLGVMDLEYILQFSLISKARDFLLYN